MKKIILGCTFCLILTSCGTPTTVTTNTNSTLTDMPLFLSQNGNTNTIIANGNTNESGENLNANVPVVTNENSNTSTNTNTNIAMEEKPLAPTTTNPTLLTPHEIAFDCKPLSIYETMPFYTDFLSQFEKLPRYSSTDLKLMIARSSTEDEKQENIQKAFHTIESITNITSTCLAKDESLFLVVVEGEKAGYGFKVVRYQPARKYIELAQREDERFGTLWNATPLFFGKRIGTLLQMSATSTTPEKTEWYTFQFNYVTNNIHLENYCFKTTKSPKTCGPYPY